MPPTIKDIANAAKVSKATVSYVINDKPGVSADTRRRVLALMEEMNFRPNAVARGLAGQGTEALGLVIPDITDMFYASIIRGVENAANELNYTLNLCTTHGLAERERKAVEMFTSRRVDGAILMTYSLDAHFLHDLAAQGVTFVTIDNPAPDTPFYSVVVDNEKTGYMATKYLLDLGHRRIAFIHGIQGSHDSESRFLGYRRALSEYGVAFTKDLTVYGGFDRDQGYKAAGKLLASTAPPTAIFAANDQMALGVLNAAQERGVDVPRRLSVIGVDDIDAAALVNPPLTTIKQPTYEMGYTAAKILLELVGGHKPAHKRISLRTELIRRGSCGPVA